MNARSAIFLILSFLYMCVPNIILSCSVCSVQQTVIQNARDECTPIQMKRVQGLFLLHLTFNPLSHFIQKRAWRRAREKVEALPLQLLIRVAKVVHQLLHCR